MPDVSPSPFDRSLLAGGGDGLEAFVTRYTDDYWLYGSGKVALRDGFAATTRPGENVCVPAYLPDAVTQPAHELDLEVRYYALEADLSPDLPDLEARIDERTAAVMSVNYFGFPQPGLEDVGSVAADHDCYHVDDNAHSAVSVHEGDLLGTRGDLGITSLPKLLPVPNGGVLYADPAVASRLDPTPLGEPNATLESGDVRYVLRSFVTDVLGVPVGSLAASGPSDVPPPADRYARTKTAMSKLTRVLASRVDVERIRHERRENYRAWRDVLEDRPDVQLRFPVLPEGICPQVCPVRADDPDGFLADLRSGGLECAHAWPRLPDEVREAPDHSTTVDLAERTVVLPVHQQVEPAEIEGIGTRL